MIPIALIFLCAPWYIRALDAQIPAYPCIPGQSIIIDHEPCVVHNDTIHEHTDTTHERMLLLRQPVKKLGSHTLTYKSLAVRQRITTASNTVEQQELLHGSIRPTPLYMSLIGGGILAIGLFAYTLYGSVFGYKKDKENTCFLKKLAAIFPK